MKKLTSILLVLIVQTTIFAQNRNTVDSLKNIIAQTSRDTVKINAYLDLSYKYENINLDTALAYADYALKKSLKINYKKGIAGAYIRKGVIATISNNYNQSDSLLNVAASIYNKINYQPGIMKCYISFSFNAYSKLEYRLMLEYCNKALRIAENNNFIEDKANIMNYMGVAYDEMGDYDKAIKCELDALKTFEKLGNKTDIAICKNNIGALFIEINEFDKALKYMNEALIIDTELKHTRGQYICLLNIGIIYSEQNKYDEALQNFNKSLELSKKNNDLFGVSNNYLHIGNIYSKQEKYNKAVEYFNKSLEIKKQIGNKNGIAACYLNIAEIKTKQKEYKLAEEYCLKSKELLEESNELGEQQYCFEQLAEIYYFTNRYKKAYNTYIKAVAVKDSVFNIEKTKKIAQLEEKYLNEKYEKEILELNCETDSQQTEILQQKKLRNIYLIAFVLALAAIILIVIQFRKKIMHTNFL